MKRAAWLAAALTVISPILSVQSAWAQKLGASVLYRQDSDVAYRAVVPGYSGPNADITGACTLDPDPANCPSPENSNGEPVYTLVGTTLSLGLPDGRIAVVNCMNRHSERGTYINRHTCGMPMGQHVDVTLSGRSAKLTWTVGPDGKKTTSENYKVVALLQKPIETARVAKEDGGVSH
jgi:hypothetical protein